MNPTPEQVAQWAREAGFSTEPATGNIYVNDNAATVCTAGIERIITRAFTEGRTWQAEQDATLCDEIEGGSYPGGEGASGLAWECADAIRANALKIVK